MIQEVPYRGNSEPELLLFLLKQSLYSMNRNTHKWSVQKVQKWHRFLRRDHHAPI